MAIIGVAQARREAIILNRLNSRQPIGPAEVDYLSGDFVVKRPGDYVLCAVSGARIALTELKYWSYERQEAYASAELMLSRHKEILEGD